MAKKAAPTPSPSRDVKKRRRRAPPPVLSAWDETFLQFLTLPATHRYLATGRPIPRRKLVVWGRQNAHRNNDPKKDPLPAIMIRMNNETGITYADPRAMARMAKFIHTERRLSQDIREQAAAMETAAPMQEMSSKFARAMEAQFQTMEQTFRAELLQLCGVDMHHQEQTVVQSPDVALSKAISGKEGEVIDPDQKKETATSPRQHRKKKSVTFDC